MGRKPRVHFPGACYHAIVRGNNRRPLFFSDRDRLFFLGLVAEGQERFGHSICAYCLMTNHVHLAVEIATIPLAEIIHNLTFRYARWIHRPRNWTGHLFERRYRANHIETDTELLAVVRYIHDNPVAAGMADNAAHYPWSSLYHYSRGSTPPWLSPSRLVELVPEPSRSRPTAVASYLSSATTGPAVEAIRERSPHAESTNETRSTPANNMSLASVEEIIDRVSWRTGVSRLELASRSQQRSLSRIRGIIALLVQESRRATLTELATLLRRTPSAVSVAASRTASRALGDKRLTKEISLLRGRGP